MKLMRIAIAGAAVIAAAAIIVAAGLHYKSTTKPPPVKPVFFASLPTTPESYLGVYAAQVPHSYAGVAAFTSATGARPELVMYYSGWLEPFRADFAATAAKRGAVPLVQIEPAGVSLKAIAAGKYDAYLRDYADAVRSYRHPVILGFGHEMNGYWYSWAYGHASPAVFVAAWRHIVTLFRAGGASNGRPDLRKKARQVPFLPETMRLDHLLVEFQRNRVHLAMLLDEYFVERIL